MKRPTKSRGRRLALFIAGTVLGMLASSAVVFHHEIHESYLTHKLQGETPPINRESVRRLGEIGGPAAARALLNEITRDPPQVLRTAVSALAQIHARSDGPTRASIAEGLLDLMDSLQRRQRNPPAETDEWIDAGGVEESILKLEAAGADDLAFFASKLTGRDERTAAAYLAVAWLRSQVEVLSLLQGANEAALGSFFANLASRQAQSLFTLDRARCQVIAASVVRRHPQPRARALALSYTLEFPNKGIEILRQVYEEDKDPIVRRAAVRIAGVLGDQPGNLDLQELFLRQNDPDLRAEIIEARSLWVDPATQHRFELAEGLCCNGIPSPEASPRDWSEEEIHTLRLLLEAEKSPRLRDAASLALADIESRKEEAPSISDFKLHEWGVLVEKSEVLVPAKEIPAGLPRFAKLSKVATYDIVRDWGLCALKPVIFLHAARPLPIHLRVDFARGRPWAFYPDPTNYVERLQPGPRVENEPEDFSDAARYDPPWFEELDYDFDELDTRYERAPWLARSGRGWPGCGHAAKPRLTGLGIEWRGLRLGYGPDLDGELPAVDPASWWARLREVPATPVAVRGGRERFVFYEGSVGLPSPLIVRWADRSRRALSLRTRGFQPYLEGLDHLAGEGRPVPIRFLPAAFVVRREAGGATRGAALPTLAAGCEPIRIELTALDLDEPALRAALERTLLEGGLTPPEARSLISVWEEELFRRNGLRTIAVLAPWIYEAMLPLQVRPRPAEVARVGIVLKECDDLKIEGEDDDPLDAVPSPESVSVPLLTRAVKAASRPLAPGEPARLALDGNKVGRLALGDCEARLSAGGTRLVWSSGQVQGQEVHLADLTAMTTRRLEALSLTSRLLDLAISGDGDRVAFLAAEGRSWFARIADVSAGTVLTAYRSDLPLSELCLSFDGRAAAFLEDSHPRRLDVQGSLMTWPQLDESERCGHLALSGDGTKLAWSSDGSNDLQPRVVLCDLEKRTALTAWEGPGEHGPVALSAGGRRLLFRASPNRTTGRHFLFDLDARSLLPLHGPKSDEMLFPALSADGRTVSFVLRGALWATDLETGRSRVVDAIPSRHPAAFISSSSDARRILLQTGDPAGGRDAQLCLVDLK